MSAVLKCLLGLFAVVCFMQFVEMARLRRDETPAPAGTGGDVDLSDIPDLLTSMIAKIKNSLDDDTVKNLLNTATTALSDGSDKLKQTLTDLTSQLQAKHGADGH